MANGTAFGSTSLAQIGQALPQQYQDPSMYPPADYGASTPLYAPASIGVPPAYPPVPGALAYPPANAGANQFAGADTASSSIASAPGSTTSPTLAGSMPPQPPPNPPAMTGPSPLMWRGGNASGFGGLGMAYSGQHPGIGARYWARLNNIGG